MLRNNTLLILVLLIPALIGCGSARLDPGEVQIRWSKNLRQLGIVPIFPPREDVVVGDIYAYATDPDGEDISKLIYTDYKSLTSAQKQSIANLGMSSRLTRLDLGGKLHAEYSKTISAPPTTSDYDRILDNPVISKVEDKISGLNAELGELEQKLAQAQASKAEAAKTVTQATYKKEDADLKVTRAEATYKAVKGEKPDTSELEDKVAAARVELHKKEDELAQSELNLTKANIGDDKELIAEAKKAKAEAEFEKDRAQRVVERLETDLETKKADAIDYSEQEKALEALASAKAEQVAAIDELTQAQRTKTSEDAKNDAAIAALEPKIANLKTAIAEARALKNTIAAAGAKHLYPQPSYENINVYDNSDNIANSRTSRLRLVAFPEYSTTTISQADLTALIPAEALKLNITGSKIDTVSVKIPAAESYGLSFVDIFDTLFTLDDKGGLVYKPTVEATLNKANIQVSGRIRPTKNDVVYLRVVSEVFYARAFDISLFGNNAFGTAIEYAKLPSLDDAAGAGDGQSSGDGTVDQFSGVLGTSTPADSASAVSTLQANLGASRATPGGTIQFLTYSENAIGLRRIFDRPIAVGVRAVTIEYRPCATKTNDGRCKSEVSSISASTSAQPSSVPGKTSGPDDRMRGADSNQREGEEKGGEQ